MLVDGEDSAKQTLCSNECVYLKTKQLCQTHNTSVALGTQHAMRVRHITIRDLARPKILFSFVS